MQLLGSTSVFLFAILTCGSQGSTPEHRFQIGPNVQDSRGTVTPLNGSTLDLLEFPNHFVQVTMSQSLDSSPDIHFKVKGLDGQRILIVIHTMSSRKGIPGQESEGVKCHEYINFRSDGRIGQVCDSIADDDYLFRRRRNFISELNGTVDIEVHFGNEDIVDRSRDEMTTEGSKSTFILDITAISDCSNKSSEQFQCTPTICIPAALECDGTFNCPFDKQTTNQDISVDEFNCGIRKRSEPTTTKPLLPPIDISSSHWPWNWNKDRKVDTTTTTSTTRKSTWVIHYYDLDHDHGKGSGYDDDNDVGGWAQQVPLIGVLIIFLVVSFLLFGMCTFLARLNTRRHSAAVGGTGRPTRRSDLTAIPNLYSIPAPEGRVYFYPDCENRAYLHMRTQPPPAYHDTGHPEAPPSYNALYKDNTVHSLPPSIFVAAAPAPSIAVSPTFEPLNASGRR